MTQQVVISHAVTDRGLAEALRTLIRRCSLGQIDAWFSSDLSTGGGIQAGTRWLEEIRTRLSTAKSVIALVTPRSVSRPWLYFEAGFGAARAELEVIPVVVGLRAISDVPLPLAMYQAFEMGDARSIASLLERIFSRFGVTYDEDMSQPVIRHAMAQIASYKPEAANPADDARTTHTPSVDIDRLINYIDRRFVQLQSVLSSKADVPDDYSIRLILDPDGDAIVALPMSGHQTVQNVLDEIFFRLSGKVEAFTYLERWVLIDEATGDRLIIKEVQGRVPAASIFEPGSLWRVKLLKKPYSAEESGRRIRGPT